MQIGWTPLAGMEEEWTTSTSSMEEEWTTPPPQIEPRHQGHIYVTQYSFKLAVFADEIFLFLSEPLTMIPNLLKDFTTFKTLTNLQIHFTKSHALNISLDKGTIRQCRANFPFSCYQKSITYLGIQLPSKLSNLYTTNYLLILRTIQHDLKSW